DGRCRLRVAERFEEPLDTLVCYRRKKIFKVYIDDRFSSDMRFSVADYRSTGSKTMSHVLQFQFLQNIVEYPLLRHLEPRHRRRDQPLSASLLRYLETSIVGCSRGLAREGQKSQFANRDPHCSSYLLRSAEKRKPTTA